MANRSFLSRVVSRINRSPEQVRPRALTLIYGRAVRFAGMAGVKVEFLSHSRAVLSLRNRKRVQNHLGTIHAAAVGLLAESASGLVVGMHVPDSRVVVLKTLHLDFLKRVSGNLKATASLAQVQIDQIQTQERGEVVVVVQLTDDKGLAPAQCEAVWSWAPKVRATRAEQLRNLASQRSA
ncbi:MAG: DUF4442 domain-containing protein [Pseudomonadota bacterium]|nr:DUF4442 domain-containing protein [Pseudomonadota bacterium]